MSEEKQNELLLNNPKSNNPEAISNKQINEMAKALCEARICRLADWVACPDKDGGCTRCRLAALAMTVQGYRKQSEGEWKGIGYLLHCSECGNVVNFNNVSKWLYNFCPNCGAKMKGGKK